MIVGVVGQSIHRMIPSIRHRMTTRIRMDVIRIISMMIRRYLYCGGPIHLYQ